MVLGVFLAGLAVVDPCMRWTMKLLRFLLLSGCLGLLPWQVQAASFPSGR